MCENMYITYNIDIITLSPLTTIYIVIVLCLYVVYHVVIIYNYQ